MKYQPFSTTFRNILFLFTFLSFTFSCGNNSTGSWELNKKANQEEWISLFDGSNFGDWTPKFAGHEVGVNYKNRFLVKDDMLSVRYAPKDTFKTHFGHLFYKEKFSHYRLKATYRFVGEQQVNGPGWAYRNNGLMLHCEAPENIKLDQGFPICLEMQLLGGNGTDERNTANLCTPGTNVVMHDSLFTPHCVNSTSKTYHGDDWVEAEVLVLGDSLIQHIMESEVVMQYSHPTTGGGAVTNDPSYPEAGKAIKDGYISIQAETAPIDFKSISLLNLCGCMDKKAKNYKSYFVKADNSSCQY